MIRYYDIDRAIQMLQVAARNIEEHCPEGTTEYDDAECDGYCVAEDCRVAADSIGYVEPQI